MLKNITRRKHNARLYPNFQGANDDHDLLDEIERLREDQRTLDDELKGMSQRLEATERRPQQMMAFLCKVVEDPEILPRVMMERDRAKHHHLCDGGGVEGELGSPDKRRRLLRIPSSTSSSGMAHSYSEDDEGTTIGAISSSPQNNIEVDTTLSHSPSSHNTYNNPILLDRFKFNHEQYNCFGVNTYDHLQLGMDHNIYIGHDSNYSTPLMENHPSYPFSLLDGSF